MKSDDAGTAGTGRGPGHESRDVNVGGLAWLVIALVMIIPLVLLLMDWTFDHFAARESREQPPPSTLVDRQAKPVPPEPRLQSFPGEDLQRMREHDGEVLATYGWVDREAGRVRIPILRAMDLLVERGLPVGPEADPSPGAWGTRDGSAAIAGSPR